MARLLVLGDSFSGEDRAPETSGMDNLKTLQIVNAAYRSMAEHRSVSPDEPL